MKYLLELISLFSITILIAVVLFTHFDNIIKYIIIMFTSTIILSIYIYFKCLYEYNINDNSLISFETDIATL